MKKSIALMLIGVLGCTLNVSAEENTQTVWGVGYEFHEIYRPLVGYDHGGPAFQPFYSIGLDQLGFVVWQNWNTQDNGIDALTETDVTVSWMLPQTKIESAGALLETTLAYQGFMFHDVEKYDSLFVVDSVLKFAHQWKANVLYKNVLSNGDVFKDFYVFGDLSKVVLTIPEYLVPVEAFVRTSYSEENYGLDGIHRIEPGLRATWQMDEELTASVGGSYQWVNRDGKKQGQKEGKNIYVALKRRY